MFENNKKIFEDNRLVFYDDIGLYLLIEEINDLDESLINRSKYVPFDDLKIEISIENIEKTLNFYSSYVKDGGEKIYFFFDKDFNFLEIEDAYPKLLSISDIEEILSLAYLKIVLNNKESYKILEVDKKMFEMIIKSENPNPFYEFPDVTMEQFEKIYEHFNQNENIKNKKYINVGLNLEKGILDAYFYNLDIDEVISSKSETINGMLMEKI